MSDYRLEESRFYKALHISYPNAEDLAAAKARGLDADGLIMIHGQPNDFGWLGWMVQRFNWTNGCFALGTIAMEDVWQAVDSGTPIEIKR